MKKKKKCIMHMHFIRMIIVTKMWLNIALFKGILYINVARRFGEMQ